MRIAFFMLSAYSHVTATLELIRSLIVAGHDVVAFTSRDHMTILAQIGCHTIVDPNDFDQAKAKGKSRHGWVVQEMLRSAEIVFPIFRTALVEMKCDMIVSDEALIVSKLIARDLKLPLVLYSVQGHVRPRPSKLKPRHFIRWLKQPIRFLSFLYDIWRIPTRLYRRYDLEEFTSKSIFMDHRCKLFLSIVPPVLIKENDGLPDHYYFLKPDIDSRRIAQRLKSNSSDLPWSILAARKCIYISLGTVFNDSKVTYDKLIGAVQDIDAEVVIGVPSSVDINLPSDPICRFHIVEFAPQILLLEVTDVFVTHCGSNSIFESIHFQVPLVGIPQAADQFGNSARMEELNLGIDLHGKFSIENTRRAVVQMLAKSKESHRLDVNAATKPHPRQISEQQAIKRMQQLIRRGQMTT